MRIIFSFLLLCIPLSRLNSQDLVKAVNTPFERLKVTGNIRLILLPSNTRMLEFESGQDQDVIKLESRENEFILKAKTGLKKGPPIKLKLMYTTLTHIEVNSGAHVSSTDTIRTEVFTLRAQTGGKAELHVVADSLSARVNQGADIILYGRSGVQSVNAYTWGNYLGYDLEVESSWVKAATGAQVKVNARDLLNISATSKASVGYWGEPGQKQIKTSGGAEVTQLTE